MNTQEHIAALAFPFDPDYRVLKRIKPQQAYAAPAPDAAIKTALVVDTETTGLHDEAKVIEFGYAKFTFGPATGQVFDFVDHGAWLEDPGEPLSDEVKSVTGLTDEIVAGGRFDEGAIAALLAGADLVIAHNAAFDRPKIERRFQGAPIRFWGCTSEQVDWKAEGIRSRPLEFIAYRMGFFYDAHRAEADCLALVHLLAQPLPVSGRLGLRALLDNVTQPATRLIAIDTPFAVKDALKRRGYRWSDGSNGSPRGWWTDTATPEAEEEWLRQTVGARFSLSAIKQTGWNRFSDRAFSVKLACSGG
jgi:DNA polymerase-3 subunit epsilon